LMWTVKPLVALTIAVPQTVYELVLTAEPTVGKTSGIPTAKLSKPLTTAVRTNSY